MVALGSGVDGGPCVGSERPDGLVDGRVDPTVESLRDPCPRSTSRTGPFTSQRCSVVAVSSSSVMISARIVAPVASMSLMPEQSRSSTRGGVRHLRRFGQAAALHHVGVDERQRGVDPDDADAVVDLDVGVPIDVPVAGRAGDPAEGRGVRVRHAGEHDEHRGDDRDEHALLDADDQGRTEGETRGRRGRFA